MNAARFIFQLFSRRDARHRTIIPGGDGHEDLLTVPARCASPAETRRYLFATPHSWTDDRLIRPPIWWFVERIQMMSISYFRRRAAQSYRDARSSLTPHLDYESLMRLGREFKARVTAAQARFARRRHEALGREETERRDLYSDSRE